jgi:hypothetical protein
LTTSRIAASQATRAAVAVEINPNRANSAGPAVCMPSSVSSCTLTVACGRRRAWAGTSSPSIPARRIASNASAHRSACVFGSGSSPELGTWSPSGNAAVSGAELTAGAVVLLALVMAARVAWSWSATTGVEHRVQVRQVSDPHDSNAALPKGLRAGLIAVGLVQIGDVPTELVDLAGPGLGSQHQQLRFVGLERGETT